MTDFTAGFLATLDRDAPPPSMKAPLTAIWHGLRGEWDRAHGIVQAEDDADSAWVHAWLHRIEGDLPNAGYWYRRAGKPMADGATRNEGEAIATALLRKPV